MDAEIFLNKDKLVVSKLGFDAANPSLSEGDKLFDSDWLFSGTVIAAGLHIDTAGYASPKRGEHISGTTYIAWDERTSTSSPQYIDFEPLPFVPTVTLISLSDSRYWSDHGMVLLGSEPLTRNRPSDYWRTGAITVTNSRITIPRIRNPTNYYRECFIYLIMAM